MIRFIPLILLIFVYGCKLPGLEEFEKKCHNVGGHTYQPKFSGHAPIFCLSNDGRILEF